MEEKEYVVKYHLGDGVVAERKITATDPNRTYTITPGSIMRFEDEKGVLYVFNSSDIKLVTVKENKKAKAIAKPF